MPDYLKKAAILLATLEAMSKGTSSQVFAHMGQERSKRLIKAMTELGHIDTATVNATLAEFYEKTIANTFVVGSRNLSSKIVKDSFNIDELESYFSEHKSFFDFLRNVPDTTLIPFLNADSDQFIACILSFLPEDRAATLLQGFDTQRAAAISSLLYTLDIPNQFLIWKLHEKLDATFSTSADTLGQKEIAQLTKLSRTFELLDPKTRANLMAQFAKTNQDVADQLARMIVTFEDLALLTDPDYERLLDAVSDIDVIATAIFGAPDTLINKVKTNLPTRSLKLLQERTGILDELKPDQKTIMNAQKKVMAKARQLEGENVIPDLTELKTKALAQKTTPKSSPKPAPKPEEKHKKPLKKEPPKK